MKNEEKFKTVEERSEAFNRFCSARECRDCHLFKDIRLGGRDGCAFNWLVQEAEEEKPLPCPFCGGEADIVSSSQTRRAYIQCKDCMAMSQVYSTRADAIAAWNRRVK